MGNTEKKIQEAGLILGGLGVIGFIGIVWLMIYGNLSGNLGFVDTPATIVNETGAWVNESANYVLDGASRPGANTFVLTNAWGNDFKGFNVYNYSIGLDNLSVAANGVVTNTTDPVFNSTIMSNMSLTYTQLQDTQTEIDAENVITNTTGGFATFFTFSNTFFTIAAIVLLIFMLVGLLAIVMAIIKTQGGKGRGFSGQ